MLCENMGGYLGIFGPPPGQSAVIFGTALDVVDALVDLEFRKCALSLSPKVPCGNASRFRHYLISRSFFRGQLLLPMGKGKTATHLRSDIDCRPTSF